MRPGARGLRGLGAWPGPPLGCWLPGADKFLPGHSCPRPHWDSNGTLVALFDEADVLSLRLQSPMTCQFRMTLSQFSAEISQAPSRLCMHIWLQTSPVLERNIPRVLRKTPLFPLFALVVSLSFTPTMKGTQFGVTNFDDPDRS